MRLKSKLLRRSSWITLVLLGLAHPLLAAERAISLDDRTVASIVVGVDRPVEVERKLGATACLVPSASGETVSYLYNVRETHRHYYLRLEVNSLVDAITISQDPPLTGVCYAPLNQPVALRSAKGVSLGLTTDEVIELYGRPAQTLTVGAMTRFRYHAMLDRAYQWDLVFRKGRLVEWSVVTQE